MWQDENDLDLELGHESKVLATKVRAGRAILGISQCEFGRRIGLTQKTVHRIEQAQVIPKRKTVLVIEKLWQEVGIEFLDLDDGSFRIAVSIPAIKSAVPHRVIRLAS